MDKNTPETGTQALRPDVLNYDDIRKMAPLSKATKNLSTRCFTSFLSTR